MKFNFKRQDKTTNKSGYAAYAMPDREKLVAQVLTSFFGEAKFYGDNSGELFSLLQVMAKHEPAFVARLGLYARTQFNMRSISHVIGAVLAFTPEGKPYTREYVGRACIRVDDMTETLAAYIQLFGKPIPNALKKGLVDALRKFDEYALAKYDRDGAVKLRDIVQLCHPVPKTPEQEALWKRVLERTLETPVTWETQLSAHGNNRETWQRLIDENALGYMAMLRNLRNILDSGACMEAVYERIADPKRVAKSRVLPFRFYAAYRELQANSRCSSRTVSALEKALKASIANIPRLTGKTLVAIDVSGSMGTAISQRSAVRCRDIACLIGAMANRICEDAVVVTFDTRIRKYALSERGGILQAAESMQVNGGGTNLHLPFEFLLENHLRVDRVILLSDNEVNRGSGRVQADADRCRKVLGKMWVHAIDLMGYGTQQFIGKNTNIIAGWSEKVLTFIPLAEEGVGSLISEIEAVPFAVEK